MTSDLRTILRELTLLLNESSRPVPATRDALAECERRLQVSLPDELRMLLGSSDGGGPTDVDHGWITFWPASELEVATESIAGDYDLPGAIVFADHGLHACWYALQPTAGLRAGAVLRLRGFEPEIVASSLTEFLRAVVEGDGRVLY